MRTKSLLYFASAAILATVIACSPKTTAPVVKEEVKPLPVTTIQDTTLSPCATFSDAPSPDDATSQFVIYRDLLKAGDWNQAFDYWKRLCCGARCRRKTQYGVYRRGASLRVLHLQNSGFSPKRSIHRPYISTIQRHGQLLPGKGMPVRERDLICTTNTRTEAQKRRHSN